ncbi:MAG: hypothetical protein ACRD0J_03280, partial [Acidimicrobiales bacterium]
MTAFDLALRARAVAAGGPIPATTTKHLVIHPAALVIGMVGMRGRRDAIWGLAVGGYGTPRP